MNNTTLLENSFQIAYPVPSETEYIANERTFPTTTSFPTENPETGLQRTDSLRHQLGHLGSVPVTNGFSFNAASGLLMSPIEPSRGSPSTSPSSATTSYAYTSLSNSIPNATSTEGFSAQSSYSHPTNLRWNDRMGDLRVQRVPALQPPSGMSPPLQSQGTVVPVSTGLMTRTDPYSMSYSINRNSYGTPHQTMNDISRYSQYPSTRTMGVHANSSSIYNHLMDTSSRASQSSPEAPPFNETNVLHSVFTNSHQTINPEIQAKIHKGFFQVDDKWTCYRRNYFSVSCSFSLRPWTPNSPLYVQLPNSNPQSVRSFAMSISAVVNAQENETRELVQHTPKRDKQSEKKPGRITLHPQHPPSLAMVHPPSLGGNHISFAAPPHTSSLPLDYGQTFGAAPQVSQPPSSHTFERIQFQKATANNGKRRAQQQYYNLVVELYAEIPMPNGVDLQWVLIAKRLSHPMVVRGRSPGHYKDGRRDSSASMGPDGGTGSSGDGNGGGCLPPGIGHGPRAHLSLMSHYSGNHRPPASYNYHRLSSTDHSPLTTSPLISSSSSSPDYNSYTMMNGSMDPLETIKDTTTAGTYGDPTFTTASPDSRKICIEPSNLRLHMPSYDDDATVKTQEDHDSTYNTAFDPMIPALQNEHDGSSQYLKRHGITSYLNNASGPRFGGSYASRSGDNSYGRLDPIQNPQSLCS
ncbi:NDT80 / PhoG like DNA-binding family protein [Histoplasma capsulatum var. duboisii H88]|uniref:NDT80 / PhoG like DNA-binding family protein n=1 Tax=Ajellomyces capsulatus (strain H88) TaxID=544711 RepID=A0A8A1LCS1_AJEC8|nr:NDT80 / PhoG like DNA-binding family protein [Histoplasma capsulatum var. duboisii H88]